MINILLRLIAAHIFGDFICQPDKLCEAKNKKGANSLLAQMAHACIQALLAYVFVAQWHCWLLPVLVGATHFIIDYLKIRFMPIDLKGFLLDQSMHILALFLIWGFLFSGFGDTISSSSSYLSSSPGLWAALIAYLLMLRPSSILLNLFLKKWEPSNPEEKGLPLGGKWIGYLERILIVTFILTHNVEGIGFLLAAKSIFRFGELNKPNEVKTTEYVLIGTFSSFTIAIISGYAAMCF